jgi:hypothetical protein
MLGLDERKECAMTPDERIDADHAAYYSSTRRTK